MLRWAWDGPATSAFIQPEEAIVLGPKAAVKFSGREEWKEKSIK
jgi:hypothetical protein